MEAADLVHYRSHSYSVIYNDIITTSYFQLSRFTERRHLVTVRVQVAVNDDESVEWEELKEPPSLVTSQ